MRRDLFFWISAVLALLLIAGAGYWHVQRSSLVEERVTSLAPLQERQLELFQGRATLILTVTTLIIGGAGALLLHFHEQGSGSVTQQRFAVLALLSGGLSAFCGYLAYEAAIWMLQSEFFNLQTDALWIPAAGQLWTSGLAILFLVICFLSASKPGGGK
jgi:hypothetical protein